MGRFFTVLALATILAVAIFQTHKAAHRFTSPLVLSSGHSDEKCNSTRPFKWEEIEPSSELTDWVECYEEFTCARLEVPLNYSDPHGEKAVLALIRDASPLGSNSDKYAGPILYNPGGPGGSGVGLILRWAKGFRAIVGPTFDLIGFDPRGVAASTPRANFFTTEVERQLWVSRKPYGDVIVDGQEARSWAQYQLLNPLIEAQGKENNDYLKHINTENTARDMLYITEKFGWKKLKYMGFSYGTILGSTFASLFPDKIERMVIDGVMDVDNYYDTLWDRNLLDIEATMQAFFDGCYAAGAVICPFWESSPRLIEEALNTLYETVRKEPIAVQLTPGHYGVVDYELLRSTVFQSLYSPYAKFPLLAKALDDLKTNGDGRAIFKLSGGAADKVSCSTCDPDKYTFNEVDEALYSIACNDGAYVDSGLDAFLEYSDHLKRLSPWAEAWQWIRSSCAAYPKYPKTHYQGPVGAANTSFPLLVIGNTADPVTPLWAAKKIGNRFGGAVVLTQESAGHCSLSAPSVCTANIMGEYMREGTLPKEGTVCKTDSPIFGPAIMAENQDRGDQVPLVGDEGVETNSMSLDDMLLWMTLEEIVRDDSRSKWKVGPLQLA
ncbi:TAP-like protein-domain-containing protein [Flagelloscypha sp. PMI_526]|nr:TAP-like protein-domain-containing protein [Flagelloscypha sp. PMI_526]